MTSTDKLIEQVARRMCVAHGRSPDDWGMSGTLCEWHAFEDRARDAIAAHIALAEIMPPDRATLLAVADAAESAVSEIPDDPTPLDFQRMEQSAVDNELNPEMAIAALLGSAFALRAVANALRAKAGGGE